MESLSLETGPSHAPSDWEAAAAAVLRKSGRFTDDTPDAEVWAALTRTTLDGIAISPLGTPALAASPTTAGRPTRTGAWDVRAHFAETAGAAAHEAIAVDLDNGVNSLWIELGAHALPVDDLGAALEGVLLDVAPVVLDAPDDAVAAATAFAALAQGTQLAPGTSLGYDPTGVHIRGFGSAGRPDAAALGDIARIATDLGCGAVLADGSALHNAGGSDAQELGFAVAAATNYLRKLVGLGHPVDHAAALIGFRLAATDEQFATIAKFRALRRLWARVLELSGATARDAYVHGVTSSAMMTKYDPWVNMLRTTVASFAAGVGGADAVTVLPFDSALGIPDAFGRRIARNTSALLIEESHVAVVSDPAGGSHVLEKLTDDLAVAGWAEFGRLEDGGLAATGPALRERMAEVQEKRQVEIAERKRPITGVSEFPNLHESLPERRPYADGRPTVVSYAHTFEALRDEPVEQQVYLATMGSVAAHTARATFASNLFAAGGIDVVNEGAHDGPGAVLDHYQGEPVVCLVGSDPAYADWGIDLADRLRKAGASWVIVAGVSTGSTNALFEQCDDSCATGIDALAFLARTREKLS